MSNLPPDLVRDGAAYAGRWLDYQQQYREIPGIAAAIQHQEQLLLAAGYGYANLELQTPMSSTHIFRVASHSKTFTATAIMQLVERRALRLDDPLSAFIPWLQGDAPCAAVTIRQALNHTTGMVRDGYDTDYWDLDYPFLDQAGLRDRVEHGGAVLPANERFKYSNIAYSLLGLVIERASGVSYHHYVKREIVDRLGLHNTGPETDDHVRARMATGYTARYPGLPRRALPDVSTNAMAAATGFYSTAEDLCHYAAGHYLGNTVLLGDDAKREMQHGYWEVAQDGTFYGLGFAVQRIDDRQLVGHGGGFPGHSTRTLIDTRDRLAVVVLTNESSGVAGVLVTGVVRILNFALKQRPARAEDAARLDRYTGRFVSTGAVTDVARLGSTLVALSADEEDPIKSITQLTVIDADTLRIAEAGGYEAPGETVRYERDGSGQITRVIFAGGSAYPPELYRRRYLAP